jgi:hypothetical protein
MAGRSRLQHGGSGQGRAEDFHRGLISAFGVHRSMSPQDRHCNSLLNFCQTNDWSSSDLAQAEFRHAMTIFDPLDGNYLTTHVEIVRGDSRQSLRLLRLYASVDQKKIDCGKVIGS